MRRLKPMRFCMRVLLARPAHAQRDVDILEDEIDRAIVERERHCDGRMRILKRHRYAGQMALADAARAVQAQFAADGGVLAPQPFERGVYGRERAAGGLIEREALGRRA